MPVLGWHFLPGVWCGTVFKQIFRPHECLAMGLVRLLFSLTNVHSDRCFHWFWVALALHFLANLPIRVFVESIFFLDCSGHGLCGR